MITYVSQQRWKYKNLLNVKQILSVHFDIQIRIYFGAKIDASGTRRYFFQNGLQCFFRFMHLCFFIVCRFSTKLFVHVFNQNFHFVYCSVLFLERFAGVHLPIQNRINNTKQTLHIHFI